MHAHVGDTIQVERQAVGRPPRCGTVLETIHGENDEHYLVRWVDGQESFYYPGPDGHVVDVSGRDSDAPTVVSPRRLRLSGSVRSVMTSPTLRIGAQATLRDVATHLAASDVGAVLVYEGEQLIGVVTERDVVRSLAAGADPDEVWAADVAPADLVWAPADESIVQAADTMSSLGGSHLPIRENDEICGVVSARDILTAVLGSAHR